MEGVMDRPVDDGTSLQAEREKWYETCRKIIFRFVFFFLSFNLYEAFALPCLPLMHQEELKANISKSVPFPTN